jgi:hypothetical protein
VSAYTPRLGGPELYEAFRRAKAASGLAYPNEWAQLSEANQRVWMRVSKYVVDEAKEGVAAIAKAAEAS